MEGHEEDELEDLHSTIYTFPPNVQNVIEQVRLTIQLSKYTLTLILNEQLTFSYLVKYYDLFFLFLF